MNEQQIRDFVAAEFDVQPLTATGERLFEIGQRLIDIVKKLLEHANVDVEVVIRVLKEYYYFIIADMQIPQFLKDIVWSGIELFIRKLFGDGKMMPV